MNRKAQIKGIMFPFQRWSQGIPAPAYDEDVIRSSLLQICQTRQGERVMRPLFGTRIWELVFEHDKDVMNALATRGLADPISQWEPRVELTDIEVERDENDESVLNVTLTYEYLGQPMSVFIPIGKFNV
jgi:hypothetical protein